MEKENTSWNYSSVSILKSKAGTTSALTRSTIRFACNS